MAENDVTKQREAFTAAAMRRTGTESKSAAPEALADVYKTLGRNFDKSRPPQIALDNQLDEAMINIGEKWWPKLDVTKKPIVEGFMNDITSPKNQGQMSGQVYQETRSVLRTIAEGYRNSDPATFRALKSIRNALDQAAERSMTPEQAAIFKTTNRQYANLKTIDQAMRSTGQEAAKGLLPPAALRTAAVKSAGGNYSTGAGDLNDLARLGQFLRPYPTSGTAERLAYQGLATGAPIVAGGLDLGTIGLSLAGPPAMYKLLESNMARRALSGAKPEPARIQELLADVLTQRMLAEQRPARGGR
jgi:hypothetical protein